LQHRPQPKPDDAGTLLGVRKERELQPGVQRGRSLISERKEYFQQATKKLVFGVDPIKWTVCGFHAATGE